MLGQQDQIDGRLQRSEASRERIVRAMLELVGEGHVSPSAESVAARAKVGLRTVFRHFENMESLYRQINSRIVSEVRPIAETPFRSGEWRKQLSELVDRRVRIFERIMPFKAAGDVHRHQSDYLAGQSNEFTREQRAFLGRIVPKEKREDVEFFEGLDLLVSFETWRRLRKDQKLSVSRAKQVLERLIAALIR